MASSRIRQLFPLLIGSPRDVYARIVAACYDIDDWLPGFAALGGCDHGPTMDLEGNVLNHTAWVVGHAAEHILALPDADAEMFLAAVLTHDRGKSETRTVIGDDVDFPDHAEVSASFCPGVADALGFTPAQAEGFEYLVRYHTIAHDLMTLTPEARLPFYQSRWFELLARLQQFDALGMWNNAEGTITGTNRYVLHIADRARVLTEHDTKVAQGTVDRWVCEILRGNGIPTGAYYGQVTKAALTSPIGATRDRNAVVVWASQYLLDHPFDEQR